MLLFKPIIPVLMCSVIMILNLPQTPLLPLQQLRCILHKQNLTTIIFFQGGIRNYRHHPEMRWAKLMSVLHQYHGTGTVPGTYSGGTTLIDPNDANIIWNATTSRWEITFTVSGFSGFYLHTSMVAFCL